MSKHIETLLRPDDAAQELRIQPTTLAKMRAEGRGPAFVKVGRRVLYRVADLNSWLDKRTVQPRVQG